MPAFAPALLPGTGPIVTFPVNPTGVTATGGAANTYGAYIQLAAAGLVTEDLRVVGVSVDNPSAVGNYKIEIVWDEGGATTGPVSICEVDFAVETTAGCIVPIPVPFGGIVPTGETIGARIKDLAGIGATLNLHVAVMPA